jgi:drug/metabolite transporter (DMT)-like permease
MIALVAGAASLVAAARTTPFVLLIVVGSLLGVFAALARAGTQAGWHPLSFLFWSLAGSGAILAALAIRSGQRPRLTPRTILYFLGSGLLTGMVPNALSFAAIPHVGVGFVALCFAFPPLLSFCLALMLGMERFRWQRAIGLALALAGAVALVAAKISLGDAGPAWIAVALAAPLVVAGGNIFRSLYWPAGATALSLAPGMLIAAALLLVPVMAVAGAPFLPPAGATALALVLAEIAVFAAMFNLIFVLQALAGPVYLSQIGSVGAAAGAAIAMLVRGAAATPGLALATLAILAGAYLVNRTR